MSTDADNTDNKKGPRVRSVPAVTRAIAILRLLGRTSDPMSLKTISQQLDMVTSTCLHILRVLVDEGLVRVDVRSKHYSLGVGMLSLAKSVIDRNPFPTLVQPALDRIAGKWGLTTMGVEVADHEHMVVLALSRGQGPFSLHVDVGSRFPVLISATGRLVAAYNALAPKELERRFKALRWDQPPPLHAWLDEVAMAREQGYSIDRNTYINGIIVAAVPLLDRRGHMTHSLVAAGVADRFTSEQSLNLAKEMQAEAQALAQLMATPP